jgi:hypothetical protein
MARLATGGWRRSPWRSPTDADVSSAIWFGAAVAYLALLALFMTRTPYDIWGALALAPVLTALGLPIIRRIVAREDPSMLGLITAAFFAKLLGSAARYLITFELYDDAADAVGYHGAGTRLAEGYWSGQLATALEQDVPELAGTPFIRLVTGVLYVVTGPTMLGGFLFFGFLSFIGLFLFYRALRVAFPEADHRRYAVLLFFLPTLLYWPSSIGKEAWMVFTLGVATYGVALILKHRVAGYGYTALGLVGSALVRPHMTALVFAALLFAYIMRRRSWREAALGPVGKVAGIGVLLLGGVVVLAQAASFFDLDSVDVESVESVLDYTEGQSSQGGSEFEAVRPSGPADYPAAFIAVLIRPYIWEAANPQMLASAAEGMVMLLLLITSWRRLARLPGLIFRTPYVAYCLAFTVMFTLAFSSISNFGNITRQRTQVFPYVLVLLSIPDPLRAREEQEGEDDEEGEDGDEIEVTINSPTPVR